MGRLSCWLGWHLWRRHHATEADGNGIFYLCDRCGHERTLPKAEGVWGNYS
ncbi:hypothetical protein [Jannaschia sp. R86511]|uniref:hypothetical protein n=1 Tax=Jannaschia sp. R86511 TaxID=3093853 RepID=UPI0036D254FE